MPVAAGLLLHTCLLYNTRMRWPCACVESLSMTSFVCLHVLYVGVAQSVGQDSTGACAPQCLHQ